MPWTLQPGTIPHRAIAFLKTQPEGAELTAATICEALGQDTNSFATCMKPAREAGLVRARRKDPGSRLLLWSLGDGTPEQKPADVAAYDARIDGAATVERRARQPAAPARTPFNAAMWLDGSIQLQGLVLRPDGTAVIPPAEAQQLRRLVAWGPAG